MTKGARKPEREPWGISNEIIVNVRGSADGITVVHMHGYYGVCVSLKSSLYTEINLLAWLLTWPERLPPHRGDLRDFTAPSLLLTYSVNINDRDGGIHAQSILCVPDSADGLSPARTRYMEEARSYCVYLSARRNGILHRHPGMRKLSKSFYIRYESDPGKSQQSNFRREKSVTGTVALNSDVDLQTQLICKRDEEGA